jgi:hypothetical protein
MNDHPRSIPVASLSPRFSSPSSTQARCLSGGEPLTGITSALRYLIKPSLSQPPPAPATRATHTNHQPALAPIRTRQVQLRRLVSPGKYPIASGANAGPQATQQPDTQAPNRARQTGRSGRSHPECCRAVLEAPTEKTPERRHAGGLPRSGVAPHATGRVPKVCPNAPEQATTIQAQTTLPPRLTCTNTQNATPGIMNYYDPLDLRIRRLGVRVPSGAP